jgi:hypothetical protein
MNQRQRIILVAERFDYEVLVAAEWLHEGYDVDISCLRLELAVDDKDGPTESKYLTLTQVYPMKELEEIAVRPGRGPSSGGTTPARSAHPEFLAVIAAYNDSAPPDLRAEGTAPGYRNIHPADWPYQKFLGYGFFFRWKGGNFLIRLSIHPDAPQGFEELLAPLNGEPLANGQASLVWDQEYHEGRGRLFAKFPLTTPAETVAQGMRDLIQKTHTKVSDKLKAIQAGSASTGN